MKLNSYSCLRLAALSSLLLFCLAGCAYLPGVSNPDVLSPEQIDKIVSSPDRTPADRLNDQRRKPYALLAFLGIRPGMVALDLSAAGGYTTELLARAVGPSGAVYGQSPPGGANRSAPAVLEGNSHPEALSLATGPVAVQAATRRSSPDALAEREQNLQTNGGKAAHIIALVQRFENPAPQDKKTGGFDLVTFMFNYHDLGYQSVDRDMMNHAVFAALKPGGVYVIADHAGRTGTGISDAGTLHRIEEEFLIREVESAGFELMARGDFLRNMNDPRDMNTPNPPQPKDELVLKFVRP